MKRGILVLAIALVAGVAAFCLIRSQIVGKPQSVLLDSMPELAWVKSELKLSDEQFAKVSALHAVYRPKCLEMCGKIAAAHEKVEDLIGENPAVTPELESAIHEHAAIHADCQQAMLVHIFQTAAVLDREQAALYLKEMLPYALDFSHSEAGKIHAR